MTGKKEQKEKDLSINLIDEPVGQIRFEIDSAKITELAESIDALGQLQPILVHPVGDRFEVVYGHRRLMACKRLGKKTIRASVKILTDKQVALMRATENLARVDMSPIEEAAVYKNLQEVLHMTIEQIAKKMGKSTTIIKRRIDLLKMPPCLQEAIHTKKISFSVGEVLWSFHELDQIEYYLSFAIENGASRAVVNGWLKDYKDRIRHQQSGGVQGGGWQSPAEARPVYVACDLCQQPMEIGKETVIRACPDCAKAMIEAFKDQR